MLWGLQELTRLDWPGQEVIAAVLFAAWPWAFVFMAGYPESLVTALAIWSIYFARTGRWWLAGILAFFAGLAKATGVMIAIPLLILIVQGREWKRLPALAIAPLGFAAFNLWLRFSGFPPTNAVYAKYWTTQVAMPWRTFFDALYAVVIGGDWLTGLNVAALIFCIAVIICTKGFRLDYLVFSLACLILFLTKHTQPVLQSTARYVLFIFPVFLYSANRIKRRTTLWIVLLVLCPFYFAMLRTFLWWGLVV
jgi:hypothetical protein